MAEQSTKTTATGPTVAEVMDQNPVSVPVSANVYEATRVILAHQLSGVTVLDDDGQLVGILSELDCLRAVVNSAYNGGDPGGALVSELMTTDMESVAVDDDILSVAKSMLDHKHRRRPVMNGQTYTGQLTCRQILASALTLMNNNAS